MAQVNNLELKLSNNIPFNSFIYNKLFILHHSDHGSGFNPIVSYDFRPHKTCIMQKTHMDIDIHAVRESFFNSAIDDPNYPDYDSYQSDEPWDTEDSTIENGWNSDTSHYMKGTKNEYFYDFDHVEWNENSLFSLAECIRAPSYDSKLDDNECDCMSDSSKQSSCNANYSNSSKQKKIEYTDKPLMKGKKLVIINISFKVKQYELWNFFSKFGDVKYCEILMTSRNYSRGIGYVVFRSSQSSLTALDADPKDLILKDREMKLFYATHRKSDYDICDTSTSHTPLSIIDNEELEDDNSYCEDTEFGRNDINVTHISGLDDYSLIQIFSYLDIYEHIKYQKVCHRWKQLIAISLSSFKSFNLFPLFSNCRQFTTITDYHIQCILRKFTKTDGFSNLIDITLTPASGMLTNKTLVDVGKKCPSLKYINISGMDISDKGLRNFAQSCPGLEKIVMKQCYKIKDDGLWWLFQKCKNLQYVDIEDAKRIKGKSFHVIGHEIRSINLRGCNHFQNSGLQKIAKQCSVLEEIDISNCVGLMDITSLPLLARQCTYLKSLIYEGFNYAAPSGENLLMALTYMKNMENLKFQKNFIINDVIINTIGASCKNLKSLDMCGILSNAVSDLGIVALAQCKYLEYLNISFLDRITDEAIELIASNGSLRQLVARGCDSLEHSSFIAVAEKCPNINLIDMIGCIFVSSLTIEEMILVREKYGESQKCVTILIGDSQLKKPDLIIPPYVKVQIKVDYGTYINNEFLGDYESHESRNDVFFDNDISISDDEYVGFLENDGYDDDHWNMGFDWS